jgi:bifunctional DNA-binding transcriptional regulator/antitoxin component of YhaV-PrlF toxin-antitoxin module
MQTARITNGQIKIPEKIRKDLNAQDGSQIAFIKNKQGQYTIENAGLIALRELQTAYSGTAEMLGLKNEEDVVKMIKEYRSKKNANNS